MNANDGKDLVTERPETGHALVACTPSTERRPRRCVSSDAAFLAHLLAIKLDVPLYRQRRRETPGLGVQAYRTPGNQQMSSGVLIDA